MNLIDSFGRKIEYLRISVTDRCDFRCVYCMSEEMKFLNNSHLLTFEEIERISRVFVDMGVNKIRITGGEPLIRHKVDDLFYLLGKIPLDDLSITTNGSKLSEFAEPLSNAGVKRINISLDSLNELKFKTITRYGSLPKVIEGIVKAKEVGFSRIKINSVIMRGHNLNEVIDLVSFAISHNIDISFIEEMPLGNILSHSRSNEFVSSEEIRELIAKKFTLEKVDFTTGGPSRYWKIVDQKVMLGFISPHSHNFCGDCNRVRLTAEGKLILCLGNENSLNIRELIRSGLSDEELKKDIIIAMQSKPERHHFNHTDPPQILRFMNATGG